MRKIYSLRYLFWLGLWLTGSISCHQEPALPVSVIPITCQIYQIANIDEGVRDTVTYTYNSFGHVEESTYRQRVNNVLTTSTKRNFTYSADHFLLTQVIQTTAYTTNGSQTQDNRNYAYTYQDALIQRVAIRNASSGQSLGFNEYVYENGRLKTYTETNAQNAVIRSYTFDGVGKLTQFQESGTAATVTNGKIAKRTLQNGAVTTYEFDNRGQLVRETTNSVANQTERTYAYDNTRHWNQTQLLLRGIPSLDLGGHTFIHNLAKSTVKQTQNGRLIQNQIFDYTPISPTKDGYLLGYFRSDGAQQRIVYANCR